MTKTDPNETHLILEIDSIFKRDFQIQWQAGWLSSRQTFSPGSVPQLKPVPELVTIRNFFVEQTGTFPGYTLEESTKGPHVLNVCLTVDPIFLAMYYLSRQFRASEAILAA